MVSLSRIHCGFLRGTRGGCIVAMHSLRTGAPGSCLHFYGWQGDKSFPDTLRLSRHLAMCFPGPLGAGGHELAPVVVLPPLRRPLSLLFSLSSPSPSLSLSFDRSPLRSVLGPRQGAPHHVRYRGPPDAWGPPHLVGPLPFASVLHTAVVLHDGQKLK